MTLHRNSQTQITLPPGMMKRGQTYSVRYSVPRDLQQALGKREVIRGLGTANLSDALVKREEVLRDIQEELSAQLRGKPKASDKKASGITVSVAAERWLASSDGIKRATKVRYRQHLTAFADYTGDIEVSKIDRALALRFIAHVQATPSERTGEPLALRSVGSYSICLASFWRVLDHWGMVNGDMRNPFSSLLRRVAGQRKKADPRQKKLRPVTREEAEALLRSISSNDRLKYQWEMFVTVRLLWSTACRLGEICGRHLSDIDDRGDHIRITIPEAKTEAGKRVVMIVNDDDCQLLREAMRRALIDKPDEPANRGMLFPRLRLGGYDRQASHYLGKALEGARKALSNDYHPDQWDMHSFRRAGVSALVNAGVAKEARNLCVGHSNADDIGVSI